VRQVGYLPEAVEMFSNAKILFSNVKLNSPNFLLPDTNNLSS